jgi:hypothetical protein
MALNLSDSLEDEKDNRVSLVWTVALLILDQSLSSTRYSERSSLYFSVGKPHFIIYILLAIVGVISVLKDAELG